MHRYFLKDTNPVPAPDNCALEWISVDESLDHLGGVQYINKNPPTQPVTTYFSELITSQSALKSPAALVPSNVAFQVGVNLSTETLLFPYFSLTGKYTSRDEAAKDFHNVMEELLKGCRTDPEFTDSFLPSRHLRTKWHTKKMNYGSKSAADERANSEINSAIQECTLISADVSSAFTDALATQYTRTDPDQLQQQLADLFDKLTMQDDTNKISSTVTQTRIAIQQYSVIQSEKSCVKD